LAKIIWKIIQKKKLLKEHYERNFFFFNGNLLVVNCYVNFLLHDLNLRLPTTIISMLYKYQLQFRSTWSPSTEYFHAQQLYIEQNNHMLVKERMMFRIESFVSCALPLFLIIIIIIIIINIWVFYHFTSLLIYFHHQIILIFKV
jgi:hypothetical protein